MIIVVNESHFINIEHIVKASVEQEVLRITFITGEEVAYFNKKEIQIIVKQLKSKTHA